MIAEFICSSYYLGYSNRRKLVELFDYRGLPKITCRLPKAHRSGVMNANGALLMLVMLLFPEAAEDHLTGSCLQHAGHGNVRSFPDQPASIIHHDHRSVIKIRHALIVFL